MTDSFPGVPASHEGQAAWRAATGGGKIGLWETGCCLGSGPPGRSGS